MTPRFCPREDDVLALVSIGQWPRQAETDLIAHVSMCAACTEAVVVAEALRDLEADDALPVPPDARAVWQHAQWRARQDAMRRAARPVVAMQGVAALGVLAAVAVALVWLTVSFSPGDRLLSAGRAAWDTAGSIGTVVIGVADAVTVSVEVPPSVIWALAAGLAVGLAAIGLAVALSTLADLGRRGKGSAGRVGSAGPIGPVGPSSPSGAS